MNLQVCPLHSNEDVLGVDLGDGTFGYTCPRSGHPRGGVYEWIADPTASEGAGFSDVAIKYGLPDDLTDVVSGFGGRWIEYGIVEARYAELHPGNFADLVALYGHRSIERTNYTVSAFLAGVLGSLARQGRVIYRRSTATGRWAYNGDISWWSCDPEGDWADRLSSADEGITADYVPGSTEA